MNELECLGHYHQLCDALRAHVADRNERLYRASLILKAASEPPAGGGALARRCNFDAAERLLREARAAHDAAVQTLEDLRQAAPAAGKPLPVLEQS